MGNRLLGQQIWGSRDPRRTTPISPVPNIMWCMKALNSRVLNAEENVEILIKSINKQVITFILSKNLLKNNLAIKAVTKWKHL